MVAVAQLVESRIVIPVVVGSSPISHPKEHAVNKKSYPLRLVALFFGALLWVSGTPLAHLNESTITAFVQRLTGPPARE